MSYRSLWLGLGVIQLIVGGVFLITLQNHASGVLGPVILGSLLVTAGLKVFIGSSLETKSGIRNATSVSFTLDGLLFILGYQLLVEVGTYDAKPFSYLLAALAGLTMIGIGIATFREKVDFVTSSGHT